MTQTRKQNALWDYLEKSGVLNGNEAQISAARKEYRKKYLKGYKKSRRIKKLEVVICLSEMERERLEREAKRHNQQKLPTFIRKSAVAYTLQTFVLPNPQQVAHIEQMLSACINEIQNISKSRERRWLSQEWKYEALIAVVEKLGVTITSNLRFPQIKHDCENKIQEGR